MTDFYVFGTTRPKPQYWSKDPKHEEMVKRNKSGLSTFLGRHPGPPSFTFGCQLYWTLQWNGKWMP